MKDLGPAYEGVKARKQRKTQTEKKINPVNFALGAIIAVCVAAFLLLVLAPSPTTYEPKSESGWTTGQQRDFDELFE